MEHQIIDAACANGGALIHYLVEGVLGISVVASALANARNYLPAWAVPVVDKIALNFISNLAEKAAKEQQ